LIRYGLICGKREVYSFLVEKPDGKIPLGRPIRRWVNKTRMDLWGEGVYRVFVGKPERKRPLGRLRC
jgi:hypothetical protein